MKNEVKALFCFSIYLPQFLNGSKVVRIQVSIIKFSGPDYLINKHSVNNSFGCFEAL